MRSAEIIIVGGGASGLTAARQLSHDGKSVIVLEARDRLGGRIHTLEGPAFINPVETGAEFVHGNLPATRRLLREAAIHTTVSGGDAWRSVEGKLVQDEGDFMGEGDILTKKLQALKEDCTVESFLEAAFSGDHNAELRETVRGFVEGYDAADISRASAFALRNEWQETSAGEQYRVAGGYAPMIRFLEADCRKHGCFMELSTVVKQITWKKESVVVTTSNNQVYTAKKIIVTVPLGVLCAEEGEAAGIRFVPALDNHSTLFKRLGYGGVIKILLLFNRPFWKEISPSGDKTLDEMGWLFSNEPVPTWWSQAPDDSALLTGWLAGPKALAFKHLENDAILHTAMDSLCRIFNLRQFDLSEMLAYSTVANWVADPFSLGAYSYATPQTAEVVKQLSIPLENTLFFAGEALYEGPEIGTVEAALVNGAKVATRVLDSF
jgi:monoamine oxidase